MKKKINWIKRSKRPRTHHRCRKCLNYDHEFKRCRVRSIFVPDGQHCKKCKGTIKVTMNIKFPKNEDRPPVINLGKVEKIYFWPLQSKN